MRRVVAALTHSQCSDLAVDFLFARPVFKSTDFVDGAGVRRETALRILRVLRNAGVLRTVRPSAGRRPSVLAFPDLVNVAEGRKVL